MGKCRRNVAIKTQSVGLTKILNTSEPWYLKNGLHKLGTLINTCQNWVILLRKNIFRLLLSQRTRSRYTRNILPREHTYQALFVYAMSHFTVVRTFILSFM